MRHGGPTDGLSQTPTEQNSYSENNKQERGLRLNIYMLSSCRASVLIILVDEHILIFTGQDGAYNAGQKSILLQHAVTITRGKQQHDPKAGASPQAG